MSRLFPSTWGLMEKEDMKFGMGILPVFNDVRSDKQIDEKFPSSLEIRKAMANNKIPRILQDAIAGEILWPGAHSEEGDTPVKDSGMYTI
jgi:hypothetical protein